MNPFAGLTVQRGDLTRFVARPRHVPDAVALRVENEAAAVPQSPRGWLADFDNRLRLVVGQPDTLQVLVGDERLRRAIRGPKQASCPDRTGHLPRLGRIERLQLRLGLSGREILAHVREIPPIG